MIFNQLVLHPLDVKNKVNDSLERKESLLLTYFNQNCLNIYFTNPVYKRLIDSQFTIYQADIGIFFALKIFGKKSIKRIDATAMNRILLEELIKNKIPVAIVGGNFQDEFVKEMVIKRGMNLTAYCNGFFSEKETPEVINNLVHSACRVVMIGMGVPKQELLALELSESLSSPIIVCVGNFFEFYFKTKLRAPIFFRKIGLEWMFRLLTEPLRLWKRYLIGIPVFFYQVIKLKLSKVDNFSNRA
jgi:N-acetylglucosaminyldiphosphoundecaprenol N-acetyl-beta-D-mannosaminyltransferase